MCNQRIAAQADYKFLAPPAAWTVLKLWGMVWFERD